MTAAERPRAHDRFQIIRPFLEQGVPLSRIARQRNIPLRTMQRWLTQYRRNGLSGLGRKRRRDTGSRRLDAQLQQFIEGVALQTPRPSVATVYRKAIQVAAKTKQPVPSYDTVHSIVRQIDPALKILAHEGSNVYSETFDLLYRSEATGPNAIWQADHTLLDILVFDDNKQARKPWLTVILDDYSRALAGYYLSFNAPSAIQTALALRQAIWRKERPDWQVCGTPQVLYTDHGSDFISQHMEQVVTDLKIQLVFSTVGKPRGRGKIERFFSTVNQLLLSDLPGYAPAGAGKVKAVLNLSQLTNAFEEFALREYHLRSHRSTGEPPAQRWAAGGFLPQMPVSLEQLDLLLLTVPRMRRVQQDGIRFMGLRYISPTLAAYVGEEVMLRYDPRDMAEVRTFHNDRFLCRAICQEMAGRTLTLREIMRARNERRSQLKQSLNERREVVESLLDAKRWSIPPDTGKEKGRTSREAAAPKLKRYVNE